LKVGGTLALESCTKITSLPENLEIMGFLTLWGCKNIESLPKGLKVNGDLNMVDSSLLKYTDDEIKKMIKPGFITGEIFR
jgi:hypothetical protein